MAKDIDRRYSTFHSFALGRNGSSIRHRIHAMARHYASSYMAKIDPNWHSIEIYFNDPYSACSNLIQGSTTSEDECLVELDYRPSKFVLVGPQVGNANITEQVFQAIPEPLVMLIRALDVIRAQDFHELRNPKHAIELIDGKTIIEFEGDVIGVVRNINGEKFDVEYIGPTVAIGQVVHYTVSKLHQEIGANSHAYGTAVDVDYLPHLPRKGKSQNTAEEINAFVRENANEDWLRLRQFGELGDGQMAAAGH